MSAVNQIIQSSTGQRQLRLLDALVADPAEADTDIDLNPIREKAAALRLEIGAIDSDLAAMRTWGWVDYFDAFGDIGGVFIKQAGIDASKDYRALLRNKVLRSKACRDEYMHWLYEGDDSPTPFLQARTFYDQAFTENELIAAQTWLIDEGLIDGKAKADGELYFAEITSRGTRAVESGRSVNEWVETTVGATVNDHSVNITDSHNINLAQHSQNVAQSNTLSSEQVNQVSDVLESYRALRDHLGLPEDQGEEAETIAGRLEGEIADANAEPGKIRQGLERLGEIVGEHGAKGIALGLMHLIEQAVLALA